MKSSYTKRALAFWLAVAMVATSAPMALALEPDTTQPVVWAGTPGEGGEGGGITSLSAEDIKKVTITPSEVTVDGIISPQDIKVEVFTDEDGNPKITENLGWEIVATNGGDARHVTVGADGVVTVDAKAKAGTYTIRPRINNEDASAFDVLEVKRTGEQEVFKVIVSGGQSKLTIPESGSATTEAFTVKFLNAFDEPVTQEKEVKWNVKPAKSENTGKVTIDNKGVVTVQADAVEDTVTVTADIEGSTPGIGEKATLTLEKAAVTSNEIKEVELSQSTVTVNGSTATPDVTVKAYSDEGKQHDITSQVAWTVETTDGKQGDVTVSQDGKVTVSAKAKAGTYTIKAGAKGSITGSGSATLTVSRAASELKSITEVWNKGTSSSEDVTDGLTLEAKQSAELFVKGLDQYGDEVTVTDKITVEAKSGSSTNLDFAVNKITAKETIRAQTTEYVTVTYDGGKLTKDIKVTVRPAKTVGTEVKFATQPAETNVYGNAITAPTITVDGKSVESGATVRYEYRRVQPNPQDTKDVLTTMPKDVGKYQVTAYYDSKDGSKHGSASTTFEITKKPVTVTADNKTITKGDAIPTLTFTVPTRALAYNDTKDALGVTLTTKATSTSAVGSYDITGTSNSKNYAVTVQKGTLTIKAEEGLRMSASKASDDSNRSRYDLSVRRGTGYLDLNADADDYLNRQTVDGSKDYWIGFDLDVYLDGVSKNIQDLYVSSTGKSTDWKKISDLNNSRRYIGDFYLDNLSGTSFTLWFDTDDDSDNSDRLYFATSSSGANEYYIDVDFDAYRGSSSSSSGSSSSDTSKVNGDRVSTTTVDKTPSVKNGSATVTFSSSALSDALDENKKEAKREDADKTYIELDVKTSKSVDDTTITVPRSSLDKIADEDTGLKLTTNQGTVTFDYRALAEIYDACDKTNIEFYLEEEDDDQYVLLIKDGSSDVIDLGRGSVEVTFDYKLKSGEKSSDVKVYRIGNGDKTWLSTYGGSTVYGAADVYAAAPTYVTDMKADYSSSKKKVTFTTDALGTFLITTDTLKTGSGSTTTTPTYNAFVDVPSSRWSATYINKLASLGIINGTGGGYFEPTLYVTREEFVKMLAGVAGANVNGYTSSRFPDVSLSRWSAPYIAWAADRGITTGTDGGNFAPTMRITREEMAAMIYRYVQSSGKTLPAKNAPVIFADANLISGWAQTPVSVMQQAGIIDGNVTNGRYTFDPKVSASREECAKMLAVLYDLVR